MAGQALLQDRKITVSGFPGMLRAPEALAQGRRLLASGQADEAVRVLSAASQSAPGDPALLRLNAEALLAAGQRRAAIGALFMAAELIPDDPEVLTRLATALFDDGAPAAALPHARRAFELEPSAAIATTLSCILIDMGQFYEALAVLDRGLRRQPRCIEALFNRGIALEGLGRIEEAVAVGRAAVLAAPEHALAQQQLATLLLSRGEMTRRVWALYESRLRMASGTWPDPQRKWNGQLLQGETVLLHAEQGLGDTIQFVRYAPMVAARGARVVLAVQPPLVRLLQGTPGANLVVSTGPNLPHFDFYSPLLGLPGLFRTTLETIPPPLAYAAPVRHQPGATLRVGVAWAGNAGFVDDRKRSVPAGLFGPLAALPGVALFSLQLGAEVPAELPIMPLMGGVRDFADTAERVAGLDLVITVDTAVAHLAATMGKPVWLLSRLRGCWRWLRGREDSPWYPSIRLFRQTAPDDWDGVMDRVRDALAQEAEGFDVTMR